MVADICTGHRAFVMCDPVNAVVSVPRTRSLYNPRLSNRSRSNTGSPRPVEHRQQARAIRRDRGGHRTSLEGCESNVSTDIGRGAFDRDHGRLSGHVSRFDMCNDMDSVAQRWDLPG